jgi:hypothetical protein
MIAAQIYRAGGAYSTDGDDSFVELDPGEEAPVIFVAFCADFDRDNPSAADRFAVGSVPPHLDEVAKRIVQALAENPLVDLTAAGQLAVWMAQSVSLDEIETRFDFTAEDVRLARALLP